MLPNYSQMLLKKMCRRWEQRGSECRGELMSLWVTYWWQKAFGCYFWWNRKPLELLSWGITWFHKLESPWERSMIGSDCNDPGQMLVDWSRVGAKEVARSRFWAYLEGRTDKICWVTPCTLEAKEAPRVGTGGLIWVSGRTVTGKT